MRLIKHIFVSLCVAGALCACDSKVRLAPEKTGRITLPCSFTGLVAAPTKSDDFSAVRVLAFDESGYLIEQVEAYGFTYGAGADGRETRFSVDLTATSEPRRLHVIAGIDIGTLPFGSETQLVRALSTTDGDTAFWQFVDLPGGIADDMDLSPVTRIPLVRNTAEISVVSTDDEFTLIGYKVVNVPLLGSVAAWTSGSGPFAGYRADSAPVYSALHDAGYTGTVPVGTSALESTGWTTDPVTVYEHPYTGDANTYTYVVLHGELTGVGHDSYYKLDLVRPLPSGANEYLDILRGIRYTMTISSMGSSGYRTEAEAVAHPAGNNVSGSVDTESLDNISDGRGQFFISTTDIVIVDDDALTFQYKFIPDVVGAPTVTANGRVSVEAPAGAVLASAASVASSDAAGGWRTVTLRPNTPEGIVYSQTIRLTTDTGLTKTIRLRLRPRYNMTVSVSPGSVDQEIGASLTATVTLPEGLPESIFPLKMVVSSDKGTVYPDSDVESMPVYVETGSFGYLKEISYSQYTANRTFTCALLTNKVKSAATVTVSNKYFNTGTAAFMNNPRYVTEFTIPAKSMIVTGLSTSWSRSYNSFQLYYDSARNSRIGNSTYNLYAYGPENNTTITVNRMLSTGMIYFYNTTRRTTVGISIEDLEAGGATLKTY